MPQVTAIEPQKKKSGRFNVYVDGHFAAGISGLTLLENNLKVGKTITPHELSKIISKEETSKLMDRVLRFLAVRPRGEKEVIDYLTQKIAKSQNVKFNQAKENIITKQILAKLKKFDYLDDDQFTSWWVASRIRAKKGPRAIKIELIAKGIDREIIDSALSKLPDQTKLAKVAIGKKISRWQKLTTIEFKKKVYQYLLSRGFDFATFKEVFAHFEKKR